MAIKWSKLPDAKFWGFFRLVLNCIEQFTGEEQNPDHMLAEGREINDKREETRSSLTSCEFAKGGAWLDEKHAFKVLLDAISPLKKLAYILDGEEGLRKLAIPSRIPVGRDDTRKTALAMLLAWDEHSSDPVFSSLGFIFDQLRDAFDAHEVALKAKDAAYCNYHDKVRSYRAIRVRGNKFVGNVKRYIGAYWDAYEGSWVKYGFEPRKKRGEAAGPTDKS